MSYPLFLVKLLIRTGIARFLSPARDWGDGAAGFLHYYSDRILTAPYQQLGAAAEFAEVQGPDAVDLALGAPRFDLIPSASTKLPADRRGWAPAAGLPELRQAVSEKLRADNQLAVHPADEVLITHGGIGGVSTVLDTFVNRGDRVVVFDPTSPLYSFALQHRGARIRWIPTWMDNGRTRFSVEQLAKDLRGARLVVVVAPNNPTGGVFAPEDLEQIAWWAGRRDALILSDEAFECYRYDGTRLSIGALPRARRRTVTVGSASKAYALASVRVGWLAGCRHLLRPCLLSSVLHTPFVPTICQQLALAAFQQPNEALQHLYAGFESKRHYVYDRLEGMGLEAYWPSGAFFFWIPVEAFGLSGRRFAQQLLASKNVLVSPGDHFGPSGPGHVRLSYATQDGRLREGLRRLEEFVKQIKATPPQENQLAA
jgi:aspartate/methionine/tyrosine aminotransferase